MSAADEPMRSEPAGAEPAGAEPAGSDSGRADSDSSEPVLSIRELTIAFGTKKHPTAIVGGVCLDLRAGRIQGLAGESGSGKTVTALAVLGLLPKAAMVGGSIRLGSTELLGLGRRQLSAIRGRRVAMVFQDPSSSLHPQLTIGRQLTDHVRTHLGSTREQARERAVELLERVRVPDPAEALGRYPHQFSGGQRQRIAIAIALACEPEVVLADEPTTALDVTVQAGILHLLRDLATERDLAVLLVTHDLGVMSAIADDVAVMRHGKIVESGEREQVFTAPRHAYTRELLTSMPDAEFSDRQRAEASELEQAELGNPERAEASDPEQDEASDPEQDEASDPEQDEASDPEGREQK